VNEIERTIYIFARVAERVKMADPFGQPPSDVNNIEGTTALIALLYTRYAEAQAQVIDLAGRQSQIAAYTTFLQRALDRGEVPALEQLQEIYNKFETVLKDDTEQYIADKAAEYKIENISIVDKILDETSIRYPEVVALIRSHPEFNTDADANIRFGANEEDTARKVNEAHDSIAQ
jgi:hypothetical protein